MLGSYTRVFTVVQMLLNLFSAKQNSFNVTVAYQRINSFQINGRRDFHLLMWFEVAWIISSLFARWFSSPAGKTVDLQIRLPCLLLHVAEYPRGNCN